MADCAGDDDHRGCDSSPGWDSYNDNRRCEGYIGDGSFDYDDGYIGDGSFDIGNGECSTNTVGDGLRRVCQNTAEDTDRFDGGAERRRDRMA